MQDGFLTISVTNFSTNKPIEDATINIYGMDSQQNSTGIVLENLKTDESGQVRGLTLPAPDIQYSLDPTSTVKPYSEYIVEVISQEFEPVLIKGTQILPVVEALQNIPVGRQPQQNRRTNKKRQQDTVYDISAHTLWGDYPPKIPESSLKPLPAPTGFVVLDEPVVPEFIVVHDGLPENTGAQNYWVPFRDYIKNVASSEIYSTWPEQTIYANVIAIISFTLNRVFTEWYRNKGYEFTITSSTAYDHKYIHNRNIFDNISVIVDEIFNTFIKRPPTARQPLLAQYCDGKKSQCPDQMTQWGSKALGDQGKNYEEILRFFYGDNITFSTANVVSGVPVSFPGFTLQLGSNNSYVKTIQNQLNAISNSYPAIEKVSEDGDFGPATEKAVKKFQEVFNLPQTGVVDFKTWYAISRIYVATTKIASLNPVI